MDIEHYNYLTVQAALGVLMESDTPQWKVLISLEGLDNPFLEEYQLPGNCILLNIHPNATNGSGTMGDTAYMVTMWFKRKPVHLALPYANFRRMIIDIDGELHDIPIMVIPQDPQDVVTTTLTEAHRSITEQVAAGPLPPNVVSLADRRKP